MLKIKSRLHISWRRILALIGLIFLTALSAHVRVPAQAVVKGYEAEGNLEVGTIVGFVEGSTSKIKAIASDNLEQMRGVVVDSKEAAVTLSSPNQHVFMATTGQFSVLVSDQNGSISANDYISVSAIDGIGMHADIGQALILGKAVTGFDGKSEVLRNANATISKATQAVHIGRVTVDIGVIRNPEAITKTTLPNFLQTISTSIAGRNVSAARVYLAAAILLISAIVSGSMLYSGVRNSMISLGRNPLSRRTIIFGLLQVIFSSLGVFSGGLLAVYLLLKL